MSCETHRDSQISNIDDSCELTRLANRNDAIAENENLAEQNHQYSGENRDFLQQNEITNVRIAFEKHSPCVTEHQEPPMPVSVSELKSAHPTLYLPSYPLAQKASRTILMADTKRSEIASAPRKQATCRTVVSTNLGQTSFRMQMQHVFAICILFWMPYALHLNASSITRDHRRHLCSNLLRRGGHDDSVHAGAGPRRDNVATHLIYISCVVLISTRYRYKTTSPWNEIKLRRKPSANLKKKPTAHLRIRQHRNILEPAISMAPLTFPSRLYSVRKLKASDILRE